MDYKVLVVIPLVLAFVGWWGKTRYDKYISIRPRLFLKLGNDLYSQKFFGYGDNRHKLAWRYECKLKNNSKYTAYDVEIIEVLTKKDRTAIFNETDVVRSLPPNNHIAENNTKEFEIATSFITAPDALINVQIGNDGSRVVMPGMKIRNPEKALRPQELNDIKLIVKYRNEKGSVFYTKYTKKGKVESNSQCLYKPFPFRRKKSL